jgi:predicted esterase
MRLDAPMKTLSIATTTHGRVLVREASDPLAVVIGFHGYMESAEIQMERLASIPGSEQWTLVSVQGLHRFYRGRSQDVIASWMTRQDRNVAIRDNIAYVDRVVETVAPASARIIGVGFSQGVAMAFRGAVHGARPARAIVAVGGDVPPELLADPAARFPPTLLARGARDDWYTAPLMDADVSALRARGAVVEPLVYAAGHEWTPEVAASASAFIAGCGVGSGG